MKIGGRTEGVLAFGVEDQQPEFSFRVAGRTEGRLAFVEPASKSVNVAVSAYPVDTRILLALMSEPVRASVADTLEK